MKNTLAAFALSVVMLHPLGAQQAPQFADYDISFGVSGNPGPEDSFNPATVAYTRWPKQATKILGFINYVHPRTTAEIVAASGFPDSVVASVLAALDTCGLIRRDSSGLRVTFAVFDRDVWTAFEPAMSSMAHAMSARLSAEIIPLLSREYPRTQIAKRGFALDVMAPVIVGAFGLDERAIAELERRDMLRIRTQHPGDRWYALLAQRNRPVKPQSNPQGGLWGIHGMGGGGVFFGTFGDNGPMNSRRREVKTLPDLAWTWRATRSQSSESIDHLVAALSHVALHAESHWFADSALPDSERQWLRPLARAGLLETPDSVRYRASFPVIGADDWRWTKSVTERIGAIAVDAVTAAEPELERAYRQTTPASNGVPLREVLNYVYHETYTRVLKEWFAAHPELQFAFDDGTLRYTGYAVVR